MARPNKEFLLAWDSLSGDDLNAGWRSISLKPSGPLDIRVGRRSPDNAEAVLIGFSAEYFSKTDKLPEGNGFSVELADFVDGNRMWLAISRKVAGSVDLFAAMSCDVVGTLDEAVSAGFFEEKLATLCIRRVAAWQEFMRKGADGLSPEEELGLAGELAILKLLLKTSVSTISTLDSWVGPIDGLQDFEIGTGAIEVKSTLSSNGFPVRVGSLEQLDDSIRQPLFLAGVRFSQNISGQNLYEFISNIYMILEGDAVAKNLFTDRLLAAGYINSHADKYKRKLTISQVKFIEVDANFPRLIPGNVPLGVRRAMYEIDIEKVQAESYEIAKALIKLGM